MILGVRRCSAFLADLGVPEDISRDPIPMRRAAQRFYEDGALLGKISPSLEEFATDRGFAGRALEEFLSPGTSSSQPTPEFIGMFKEWDAHATMQILNANLPRLQAVFDHVARAYGDGQASDLWDWGIRIFVDRRERSRWRNWSRLLPVMAEVNRLRGTDGTPALPPSSLERFVQTTRTYFGPQVDDQDAKLMEQASRIPLSYLEKRWVTGGDDGGPEEEPARGAEFDLLTIRVHLPLERASRVLRRLRTWMGPLDWEMFHLWARAEAKDNKITSDFGWLALAL